MSEIEADIELINAQLISFDAMSATEVEQQWYIGAKAARSAKQMSFFEISETAQTIDQ
ncbi:hypothetical protein ACV1EB_14385 [Aeromonas caviae]